MIEVIGPYFKVVVEVGVLALTIIAIIAIIKGAIKAIKKLLEL